MYIVIKAPLIRKQVKLIYKKEFVTIIINLEDETFIVDIIIII